MRLYEHPDFGQAVIAARAHCQESPHLDHYKFASRLSKNCECVLRFVFLSLPAGSPCRSILSVGICDGLVNRVKRPDQVL